MRWLGFAFFSLFLTACQTQLPEIIVDKSLSFGGQVYQQVTNNQIDQMGQQLYLPENSAKNPDDWQEGVLLFSDHSQPIKSIEERVTFRKSHFNPDAIANVRVENNELRSEIIYPPTARFHNVQLEATRGKNSDCGYLQMQVSQKHYVAQGKKYDLNNYIKAMNALAVELANSPWFIRCNI